MLDQIDPNDFSFDNVEQNILVYGALVDSLILEDSDRELLKKQRGFSDQIIDSLKFKSCQPSNKEIISDVRIKFGDEALVDAGLLEYNQKNELVPCIQLVTPNILIPYFNENKQIYYIRPHKFGLKDKGISIYCPVYPNQLESASSKKTWVIAESEFKAAASVAFGIPAIGLPGIHSYAANNFHRLVAWFKPHMGDIHTVVILFDNEIKNDIKFPNYKPDVMKQWDTQWRSAQLARELSKELKIKVLIGKLPDSWMVDGKIDIDGALAQGRSKEEYALIIKTAKNQTEYVSSLPPVAQQIIVKKFQKLDFKSPIIKKDNCYYVKKPIKKKKSDEEEFEEEEDYLLKKISNFTMSITKTVVDNSKYSREVVFKGEDGTISPPHSCPPDMLLQREFVKWAGGCGNYIFTGSQEDLYQIYELEFVHSDGRKVSRPQGIGFLKKEDPPLWLFGNCAIKLTGELLMPDKEDVIWDGLEGYQPSNINVKETLVSSSKKVRPQLSKTPVLCFDESIGIPQLFKIIENIRDTLNTKTVYLAVGWVIANLFSDEIFRQYNCFPFLFVSGRTGCGKTTLCNWLMAFAGFSDAGNGDSLINTSEAGVNRTLEWFNSLPYWLDEYRNDAKVTGKWDAFLRNAYQRQNTTKGTLTNKVRAFEINAGILLAGEESPQDSALLSRCIVVNLNKASNQNRDMEAFSKIENLRRNKSFSRLVSEVIKRRQQLFPSIFTAIEGMKERLVKNGVGDRLALNYAIATAFFQDVFLSTRSESEGVDFINFVINEAKQNENIKENEHMLSVFMDDLITLQEDIKDYYEVFRTPKATKGRRRMALHWKTFYSKWVDHYRRKGNTQFKQSTMLSYLEEESYYIGKNVNKRIGPNRKMTRCLILSLDPEDNPPQSLLTLADGNEGAEIDDDDNIAIVGSGDDLPF